MDFRVEGFLDPFLTIWHTWTKGQLIRFSVTEIGYGVWGFGVH